MSSDEKALDDPPEAPLPPLAERREDIVPLFEHFMLDAAVRYGRPAPVLTDRQRRVQAVVVADGTLRCGELHGSIHQVGAAVQNAPSCNGWTFWHIDHEGKLEAIDALRAHG